MANTSFPDSAVVYILDDIPGVGEFQGTGVIIGPHSILTAAHLVYDADTGATADAVSLYPGFAPGTTAYNPAGALGGFQSIHTIKVADGGDEISARATQSDFAVIDTSADLSAYGAFALDPSFTSGDVIVKGYPSSKGGNLAGAEAAAAQDGALSDIRTEALPLSPGYSGGPLYDTVERGGSQVAAVAGTVSTNVDAMKLTRAKVALIRHWIASDQSLYAGGRDAPRGLIPQLSGTASGNAEAAAVSAPASAPLGSAALASTVADAAAPAFAYSHHAAHHGQGHRGQEHHGAGHHGAGHPVAPAFADLVNALQMPSGGDAAAAVQAAAADPVSLAAPVDGPRGAGVISADG